MQIAAVAERAHVRTLSLVFVGLALALLLLPLAASAPLIDPDEGLHAAIAQEMVLRHDYATPTFLGEPFFDKPILFFWAEALSLRLFGLNETAIRIPPLIFGLLGMISVAALARELFDRRTGLVAGIIYGSMLLPLGVSEVAVHDVALIPFLSIAVLCLRRATRSLRPLMWALPIGTCLGLSILTKGLVGVVFVGIFAGCLAVADRGLVRQIAVVFAASCLLAIVIAAPWYIAMERAHPGYLWYYFVERHLRGYLTATQRHAGRPWWYYLPIIVGGTLPWTGYLVGAARSLARDARDVRHRTRVVIWCWCGFGLLFLTAGESKLVTYALPLFPGLATLAAEFIVRTAVGRVFRPGIRDNSRAHIDDRAVQLFRLGAGFQALALIGLPVLAALIIQRRFASEMTFVWAAVAATVALIALFAFRAWRSTTLDAVLANISTAITISVILLTFVLVPRAAVWMTGRDLALALNTSGRLPAEVSILEERIGSIVFYLSPALRTDATSDRIFTMSRSSVIDRLGEDPPDAVIAVRDDELGRFLDLFRMPPAPEFRAGTFSVFRIAELRESQGL